MSAIREVDWNDQELVRYLLGEFDEREAERLDEASFVNDRIAARLRDVENDLVDAYVGGTLPAETRARFERSYLASPHRRRKVAFAKRFLTVIDRAAPSSLPGKTPSRFAMPLLAAAASLLIACGVLLVRDLRLRDSLNDAVARGQEQQRQLADLATELGREKAERGGALRDLERARTSAAHAAEAPVATRPSRAAEAMTMVLLPQTRSLGPLPTLGVSARAERVSLDLRLESNEFTRFDAVLKDAADNRAMWRSGALGARTASTASFVTVAVPASVLQPQRYVIELFGVGDGGRREPVATYAFQIEGR